MSTLARLAISLGMLNPRTYVDAAQAADRLGFDAVFMSDHVVFPARMEGTLRHGAPPPPASTPLTDPLPYLAFLAGRTVRVRLGTFVYLLGLRHPFLSARGFATLDIASGGRSIVGVGAGWLTSEWDALGLDPSTRGSRLDEAVMVCRRLWSEEVVEHSGSHFSFEPVYFEPKPFQRPGPPVMVGGESSRALRRAAQLGDGWLGMRHTPESAARVVRRLGEMRDEAGRTGPFEVTVMGHVRDRGDLERWAEVGVDRVVVTPWRSSREAIDAMEALAQATRLTSGA